MSALLFSAASVLTRGSMISGSILFVYVTAHLLAHAVGLGGLELADAARPYLHGVWRTWMGQIVLYGAFLWHVAAVLEKLFLRRRWAHRAPLDHLQVFLGLSVLPLLAVHILGTRGLGLVFGVQDSYAYVLAGLVILSPQAALMQAAAVLVTWTHGCLGLYHWVKVQACYPRYRFWLSAGAVAVPLLALGGFATMARETLIQGFSDPDYVVAVLDAAQWPGTVATFWMATAEPLVRWSIPVLVALIFGVRLVRLGLKSRGRVKFAVHYPDGHVVAARPGMTVLDASRQAGIPHAAVCGGRGRCSTCRVRVRSDVPLPPKGEAEQRILARVSAPDDVRLACQLKPTGDLDVVPILASKATVQEAQNKPSYLSGDEREIVVMFADLRGFTELSANKLPFDVVFLLNQYFRVMGAAIEQNNGQVDKFLGDGIMALFGVSEGPVVGAQHAVTAAAAMSRNLKHLNAALKPDLPAPLQMGLGVHVGPAIVGEMGYGRARSLTAIGDVVNVASRLESASKTFEAEATLSLDVMQHASIAERPTGYKLA